MLYLVLVVVLVMRISKKKDTSEPIERFSSEKPQMRSEYLLASESR